MGSTASGKYPFDIVTLTPPDGSVTAKFVSFGATLVELWVRDRRGQFRDVVLGYDDNSLLQTDPAHPVFNSIVGRYANRIRNGRFSVPSVKGPKVKPRVYQVATNDNGKNTLHGGVCGWDRRCWTIIDWTPTSVTYRHIDVGDEGFPGTVTAYVTYAVGNGGVFRTNIEAFASQETPIMLTQHIYWNLDAFQNPPNFNNILNHHLYIPNASKTISVDDVALPTGGFDSVEKTPFDFRLAKRIGERWNDTAGLCGKGCYGYNSCWVYDLDSKDHSTRPQERKKKLSLWSDLSGIRVDIESNQPAAVVYTSYYLDTIRKRAHGGGPSSRSRYDRYSAVAIEMQGHVDAINHPEWGVDQIYHPGRDYYWSTTYSFSVI